MTTKKQQSCENGNAEGVEVQPMVLSHRPLIRAYLGDCMDLMQATADKAYDLAIVDPPYGLGDKLLNGGHTGRVKFHELYSLNKWDNDTPDQSYFEELRRVSKNQIIWGGNYFELPPTRGIVCWDKRKGNVYNFSQWEMAWTSFDCIARLFSKHSHVVDSTKIHPTQKPVALYRWLLQNYAEAGQRILDTHGGSFSSAVACFVEGYDLDIIEIDKEYFDAGVKRFKEATKQIGLFDDRAV